MSYIPWSPHIRTTENTTGDFLEGKAVYRKMVKHSGNLSTGTNNIAHGISGLTKVVGCYGTVLRSNGTTYPMPSWNDRAVSNFNYYTQLDGTNIIITVGTAWTGAGNVLSDPWIIIEYLK